MVFSALKKVFLDVRYMMLAGIIAFGVFVLSTWLSNLKLILVVVTSPIATLSDKLSILVSLLGSIQTNFSAFSASYTIVIAILFGINIAMIVYYIRQRRKFLQKSGMVASFGGLVSGMLGIGCAACGTFVLGPLLSLISVGGLIAFFPFGGQEFGVLGVGILSFSIFLSAKKIQSPLICKTNN